MQEVSESIQFEFPSFGAGLPRGSVLRISSVGGGCPVGGKGGYSFRDFLLTSDRRLSFLFSVSVVVAIPASTKIHGFGTAALWEIYFANAHPFPRLVRKQSHPSHQLGEEHVSPPLGLKNLSWQLRWGRFKSDCVFATPWPASESSGPDGWIE